MKYYTDIDKNGYAIKLIEEEITKLQKYLDDNFGYHKFVKSRNSVVDLMGEPSTYDATDDDYFLMRFKIVYGYDKIYAKHSKGKQIPQFYFIVNYEFMDLFLHPEDRFRSGEEKYNTVSLKPISNYRDMDRLHYCGLLGSDNYPCTDYIYKEFDEIQERIKERIHEELGQTILFSPFGGRYTHRYHNVLQARGKPEQYKEYFCNVILYHREEKIIIEHIKSIAKKEFGLIITDEDLKNITPIEDLFGYEKFGRDLNEYVRQQSIKEREAQLKEREEQLKHNQNNSLNNVTKIKRRPVRNEYTKGSKSLQGKSLSIPKEEPKKKGIFKFKERVRKEKPIRKPLSIKIRERMNRRDNKVLNFLGDSFAEFSLVDVFQVVLPTILMLIYAITSSVGWFARLQIPFDFTGTLFGYNFELSNLALQWFEGTKHGFFSAITLGLFQLILIVLGFILDLVVHLVFLILSLLWLIIINVLINCLYFVLPVAIPVWLLINFFRVEKERKIFSSSGFIISVICCVIYFIALQPYLK